MIQFIRERSQFILWTLVVITIISFALLGNFTPPNKIGNDRVMKLTEDFTTTQAEFSKMYREAALSEFIKTGQRTKEDKETQQMLQIETYRRLFYLREAKNLGISISDREVATTIKDSPLFHGESGSFSKKSYEEFCAMMLSEFGAKESDVLTVFQNDIICLRVGAMLSAGANVSPMEVNYLIDRYFGKTSVSVVEYKYAEYAKDVKLTDQEIQQTFDLEHENLKSEEKRQIQYVKFSLSPDKAKLTGDEKEAAVRALKDKAETLSAALLTPDGGSVTNFSEVAKAQGLSVSSTPFFTLSEPPTEISGAYRVLMETFRLTPDHPGSDAIADRDDCYVAFLTGLQPSVQLDLEGARPMIVHALTAKRGEENALRAAADARKVIGNALSTGKTLDAALAEAKATPKKLRAFVPVADLDEDSYAIAAEKAAEKDTEKPAKGSDAKGKKEVAKTATKEDKSADEPIIEELRNLVAGLPVGYITPPQQLRDRALVVIVNGREQPRISDERRTLFRERLLNQRRSYVLNEWLGRHFPQQNNAGGGGGEQQGDANAPAEEAAGASAPAAQPPTGS